MYMLDSKWPSIEKVTGIDLSTFKLAIAEEKKTMMVRCNPSLLPEIITIYLSHENVFIRLTSFIYISFTAGREGIEIPPIPRESGSHQR
jgi:hypothetical protein